MLLSSEELAKADPAALIGLRDLGGDTRVLVYLRDQADMMVSRFNQLRGYGKFGLGRNKLRDLALKGEVPGIIKASW